MSMLTVPQIPVNVDHSMVKPTVVASQADLQPKNLSAPIYKYKRAYQIQGGSTISITDSTAESTFNIAAEANNFGRSYLSFDTSVIGALANNFNVFHTDFCPIDRVQLRTTSGTVLVDLQNVGAYTKTARWAQTSKEEYLSRDTAICGATSTLSWAVSHQCQPIPVENVAGTDLDGNSAKYFTDNADGKVCAATDANEGPNSGFQNPQVFATTDAVNTAAVLRYKIDLNAMKGTLLSLDKTFYFGEILQLTIVWSPKSQWGLRGPVAFTTAGRATLPNFSINNLYLYVAQDVNSVTSETLKAEVKTNGIKCVVPYTMSYKRTSDTGASFTFQTPLTAGMGLAVKRIYTSCMSADNQYNLANNAENVGGINKVQDLQSSIDSKFIQDQRLSIANHDAWNYIEPYLYKSSLLNERNWQTRFFWCDVFGTSSDSTQWDNEDMMESGLELGIPKNYEINFTKEDGVAQLYYQWVTVVRNLVISPAMIQYQ